MLLALVGPGTVPTADLAAQSRIPGYCLLEELRIGREGRRDYELSRVTDLVVDSTGRVFVAQPLDGEVRVYGSDGRFLRSVGGPGEGPGEFRSITALGWVGDTLWAVDSRLGRVTLFPPTPRQTVMSLRLRVASTAIYGATPPTALLADGTALFIVFPHLSAYRDRQAPPALVLSAYRDRQAPPALVLRVDREGVVLDTLGWLDRLHRHRLIMGTDAGGLILSTSQPFDDSPMVRVQPHGKNIVRVDRAAPTEEGPAAFTVTVLSPAGAVRWVRSYRYDPEPVPAPLADSVVHALADRFESSFRSQTRSRDSVRAALFLPPFAPPVTDVVVGERGRIWLRRDIFAADGTEWTVLEPSGGVLGEVETREPVRLLYARGDRVWGVARGAFDVPRIVRLRLAPAPEAGCSSAGEDRYM